MRVSVVVPNYNGAAVIERCLDALAKARGVDETIVVDDGSTDGSDAAAAGRATVLRSSGKGYAPAMNYGIAHAQGELILLLNSDAFVAEDTVERLIATLDADPRRALCGARLIQEDGQPAKFAKKELTLGRAVLFAAGYRFRKLTPTSVQDVEFVPLPCVLARREALDRVGGIDEGYGFYFEDNDLCRRVRAAGMRIAVDPDAVAVHVGGGSSSKGAKADWFGQFHRSRIRFLRLGYPRGWVLFAAVWAVNAAAHTALWLLRATFARADRRLALAWARAYAGTIFP